MVVPDLRPSHKVALEGIDTVGHLQTELRPVRLPLAQAKFGLNQSAGTEWSTFSECKGKIVKRLGSELEVIKTDITDIKVIKPVKFGDSRGFFSETYNKRTLASVGIDTDFVQDSHTLSKEEGTIRGLHFQAPPFAQTKLVRVVRGKIFDVAVDIRLGSPTYGKVVCETISDENWHQILVPSGFAHGFCTLVPDTEVVYKVSGYYKPDYDFGILWNDPDLNIKWPVSESEVNLSEKDKKQPRLKDIVSPFHYAG